MGKNVSNSAGTKSFGIVTEALCSIPSYPRTLFCHREFHGDCHWSSAGRFPWLYRGLSPRQAPAALRSPGLVALAVVRLEDSSPEPPALDCRWGGSAFLAVLALPTPCCLLLVVIVSSCCMLNFSSETVICLMDHKDVSFNGTTKLSRTKFFLTSFNYCVWMFCVISCSVCWDKFVPGCSLIHQ